jgi:5-methylcytosine-specific restriction endonuclease McrA
MYRKTDYQPRTVKQRVAKVRAWRKAHPDRLRAASRRWRDSRRARQTETEYEHINPKEIYDRDGGRCHICHNEVPLRFLTLDHLIPVALGGPTVAPNLAVAHRSCNSRMGVARLPAQLRLM